MISSLWIPSIVFGSRMSIVDDSQSIINDSLMRLKNIKTA